MHFSDNPMQTTKKHTREMSNNDDDTDTAAETPTSLANVHTEAAIKNVSVVGGFSGRALARAIEESGEELVDALTKLFSRVQQKRLESSNTATSGVQTTKHQTVYIKAIFQRMGDIDTASEMFKASVSINAKWREPNFDGEFTLKPEKITWSDYWNPELYIGNYLGNLHKDDIITRALMFNGDEAYVIEKHQLTGHFHEKLELERFPFDIQKFKVVILSKLSTSDVTLVVDEDQWKTSINTESFDNKQEWRLYSHVSLDPVDEDELPTKGLLLSRTFQNKPQLLATSIASRKYGFYVVNFMFTLFFITCMAFCTFAIEEHLVENRLEVTVILLLTIVAFKNVVNEILPRYSYLTYMDVYILTSMGLLGVICIWHAIAAATEHDASIWVDKGILIGLGSLYGLFNMVYVAIYIRARITRYHLAQKENVYISKIIEAEKQLDGSVRQKTL